MRLVEVGDDGSHDVVVVARRDDDLRVGVQNIHFVSEHIVQQPLQRLRGSRLRRAVFFLVGHPLRYVQFFGCSLRRAMHDDAEIVEALQRAHRRRAHSHAAPAVSKQPLQCGAVHGNPFRVHGVSSDFLALHGAECAGANVECHFVAFHTFLVQGLQHLRCEVQSGGRSSHGAFHFAIDRLIGRKIRLLCGSVQIGWDG